MGTLLEAIGIVLETYFGFGLPNRSTIGDSLRADAQEDWRGHAARLAKLPSARASPRRSIFFANGYRICLPGMSSTYVPILMCTYGVVSWDPKKYGIQPKCTRFGYYLDR